MSKTFLKIKIMSLAAEASIIRAEERKWPRRRDVGSAEQSSAKDNARVETRLALASHRRFDVRSEARSALLAYGFLRGKPYRKIEAKFWDKPDRVRVAEIAVKFGGIDKKQALQLITNWMRIEWILDGLPRSTDVRSAEMRKLPVLETLAPGAAE